MWKINNLLKKPITFTGNDNTPLRYEATMYHNDIVLIQNNTGSENLFTVYYEDESRYFNSLPIKWKINYPDSYNPGIKYLRPTIYNKYHPALHTVLLIRSICLFVLSFMIFLFASWIIQLIILLSGIGSLMVTFTRIVEELIFDYGKRKVQINYLIFGYFTISRTISMDELSYTFGKALYKGRFRDNVLKFGDHSSRIKIAEDMDSWYKVDIDKLIREFDNIKKK